MKLYQHSDNRNGYLMIKDNQEVWELMVEYSTNRSPFTIKKSYKGKASPTFQPINYNLVKRIPNHLKNTIFKLQKT